MKPALNIAAPVLFLVAVAAGSLSCAHSQQVWQASGESVDALGRTFLATGHALDDAYDKRLITEAQHEKWRTFVHYFKPLYDQASDRWLHYDDSAAAHAAAVLAALAAELAEWTALSAQPKGAQ